MLNITFPINEEWRSINGYLQYQISNIGRVRDISGRILKPHKNNKYQTITLKRDGVCNIKLIHRLVANEFLPNPLNKPIIDHINHNTYENHINNLRWATYQENAMNTQKQRNTTSTYKGVYFNKPANKWLVRIHHNGISHHIGYFENEIEGAKAYNEKAIELFGEYACLNDIP